MSSNYFKYLRNKSLGEANYVMIILLLISVTLLTSCSEPSLPQNDPFSFRSNDPFNKDIRDKVHCRKTHPNMVKPDIEVDESTIIDMGDPEQVDDQLLNFAEKYAYAMGVCLYQATKDETESKSDSNKTIYEFLLLNLVTYEIMEMDIIEEDKKLKFDEIERNISLKKINNYQDLQFVVQSINAVCQYPKDEDKVKIEISHRDPHVFPGISLKGKNIYYEFECKALGSTKTVEYEINTETQEMKELAK